MEAKNNKDKPDVPPAAGGKKHSKAKKPCPKQHGEKRKKTENNEKEKEQKNRSRHRRKKRKKSLKIKRKKRNWRRPRREKHLTRETITYLAS